jgi:CubicO group peptidase (beta-lactamase class C family)
MRLRLSRASGRILHALLCMSACSAMACAGPANTESSLPVRPPAPAFEHALRPIVLRAGEVAPAWSLAERMAHHGVPGVAIAILHEGEIVHAAGYGVRAADTSDAVDADTLFSVGSISKVITAAISLRLVARGVIDLDRDIGAYLTSWSVPPLQDAPAPAVTMRMLMSHTAGFNVHGFRDYQPGEPLPTLVQILAGEAPAKNQPVRLELTPGAQMDYSGGGVTVEQLVLEDAGRAPFEQLARAQVFEPLGMRRSTFENPLPASRGNIAKAHDRFGRSRALPRGWEAFPELAASGLWTSASELAAFVRSLILSYRGASDFLPRPLAIDMMTEVSPSWHGLGPRLNGWGDTRIFHHGGANDSYMAWIEGHLETGHGLVVLTNGPGGGELYDEIRGAVADTYGWPTGRAVRTIALPLQDEPYRDYAGTYAAQDGFPGAHRKALGDFAPELQIALEAGRMSARRPGGMTSMELLPVTPSRFVAPSVPVPAGTLQVEFHRAADGAVRALTVDTGASRAYYERKP